MVYVPNTDQQPAGEADPKRPAKAARVKLPLFLRWALFGAVAAVLVVLFVMQWGWGMIDSLLGLA